MHHGIHPAHPSLSGCRAPAPRRRPCPQPLWPPSGVLMSTLTNLTILMLFISLVYLNSNSNLNLTAKKYQCLVSDAFYIPYYIGLDALRYLYGNERDRASGHGAELISWLENNGSWSWSKRGGMDHFIATGRTAWDLSSLPWRAELNGERVSWSSRPWAMSRRCWESQTWIDKEQARPLLLFGSKYTAGREMASSNKVGVCYGMVANNLPLPDQVANLIRSHNIGKVRLFQAHQEAQGALQNSGGIEVIVGVGNDELQKVAYDQAAANGWVNDNIRQFYPATNIKYIAVGNEVFPSENRQHLPYLVPAMRNIQTAVKNANLQSSIKVSTTHASSVLGKSYPPSQGEFADELKSSMSDVLNFLGENGAPFMANVYPYISYNYNKAQISLDYALFRSADPLVNDGGRLYRSLFDALVDSLISAMEKSGHPNIHIVITESGWPSAGNEAATVENAQTYNNNLIKHVLPNAGTPKRPGQHIDTYIFALFNENLKGGDKPERHFGLFYPDQNLVYPVNFSP